MPAYLWSHFRINIVALGERPKINGRVWFRGKGDLFFGSNVILDATKCPIELHVMDGARLEIGNDAVIASGSSIESTSLVVIGRGTRVGMYCKILDNNFHPLRGDRRQIPRPNPVQVGDNVTLENNVILLPGARIGDNVKVLARSVVSRTIPPNVVVSGNPSRIV